MGSVTEPDMHAFSVIYIYISISVSYMDACSVGNITQPDMYAFSGIYVILCCIWTLAQWEV